MTWEEAMWAELDALPEAQRIVAIAENITRMSQGLLPLLGDERRLLAVQLVESKKYTYATLAESIGSRIGTVQRLVEEGRRILRDRAEVAT
jgi:DNA-directed RNA polymerase specialized sigma24 family protein